MSAPDTLESSIKDLIVDLLGRTDLADGQFDSDAPLVGEGVALDSLDVLEVVQALEERYAVTLDMGSPDVRDAMRTVHGIADYLREHDGVVE